MKKQLNILGIRGFPAAHGGFETFAAHFSRFMRDEGWTVSVYCQGDEGVGHPKHWEDEFEGVRRVHFDTRARGALATMEFDLRCVLNVRREPGIDLVLGYNTAVFNLLQRVYRRPVLMNMDGIEWKRQKWGGVAKLWFWLNEWIGCMISTLPIADHPEIAAHLVARGCRRHIAVIPYGSDRIDAAPTDALNGFGLEAYGYFISIARVEPENSILEIVNAFVSAEVPLKLVVLGKLEPEKNPYHAQVLAAANGDVIFPGAIYDQQLVGALRFFALAYMHGHQVGGTNPSLVEALGAGSPVIAHDNRFNRWTAGERQMYFSSVETCAACMRQSFEERDSFPEKRKFSQEVHAQRFTFDIVHRQYLAAIESQFAPRLEAR